LYVLPVAKLIDLQRIPLPTDGSPVLGDLLGVVIAALVPSLADEVPGRIEIEPGSLRDLSLAAVGHGVLFFDAEQAVVQGKAVIRNEPVCRSGRTDFGPAVSLEGGQGEGIESGGKLTRHSLAFEMTVAVREQPASLVSVVDSSFLWRLSVGPGQHGGDCLASLGSFLGNGLHVYAPANMYGAGEVVFGSIEPIPIPVGDVEIPLVPDDHEIPAGRVLSRGSVLGHHSVQIHYALFSV